MADYKRMIADLPSNARLGDSWSTLIVELWRSNQQLALEVLSVITHDDLVNWSLATDETGEEGTWGILAECFGVTRKEAESARRRFRGRKLTSPEVVDVLDKIQSIASDRGLNSLEILSEARVSSNLATFIQKNATKTNPYENLAACFLERRTSAKVSVFRLADSSSRISIRFDQDGQALVNVAASSAFSKDADIAVVRVDEGSASIWLVTHKFARVAGGHQDNQLKDAATYLRYASQRTQKIPELVEVVKSLMPEIARIPEIRIIPTALLDGEFFEMRVKILRGDFQSDEVFIGTSDDLVELL